MTKNVDIEIKEAVTNTDLLQKIEQLEQQNVDNQAKLQMLEQVADKGRVLNYENQQGIKKSLQVKLSVFGGGIIIGWQTIKDILIKNPTTGMTVGEEQEYEIIILLSDDTEKKLIIKGYPAFSDARYNERIEVEVIGKKENYTGEIEFEIQLPNNRTRWLNSRFVN